MANEYAYTGLTLNGKFDDTGEYFQLFLELNGVPIRFGNVYVGDQREAFTEAAQAGQPKAEETAAPAA
jgi:hypothetical protein